MKLAKTDLKKLKKSLPSGAAQMLAESQGVTQSYVRMVLNGDREDVELIEAAIELAEAQKRLEETLKEKIQAL